MSRGICMASIRKWCHEKNWINVTTPNLFSVYGDNRRTNNDVESCNRMINNWMGEPHKNTWDFLSKFF